MTITPEEINITLLCGVIVFGLLAHILGVVEMEIQRAIGKTNLPEDWQ